LPRSTAEIRGRNSFAKLAFSRRADIPTGDRLD
jgi:hypothetical protein